MGLVTKQLKKFCFVEYSISLFSGFFTFFLNWDGIFLKKYYLEIKISNTSV